MLKPEVASAVSVLHTPRAESVFVVWWGGVPCLRVPLEGFKACGSEVLCIVEELPCEINKLQFLT